MLGVTHFGEKTQDELKVFLLPIALSTHRGWVLMTALVEEMRTRQIILPSLSTLEAFAWNVRRDAERQVFQKLLFGLTGYSKEEIR